MNTDAYLVFGSILAIIFMGLGVMISLIRSSGMGLEKLYPLILLVIFIFLVPLLTIGKISESTFSTFLGVIIGAFVTAFKELVERLFKNKKTGE